MRNFKKYKVWEDSHHLVLEIYKISKSFPKEEMFSLTSQLKRATSSIPTNFSEGCGSNSDKEFARYIGISIASCSEVEYLLILSKDLQFISIEEYEFLLDKLIQIRKQLYSLRQKIIQS